MTADWSLTNHTRAGNLLSASQSEIKESNINLNSNKKFGKILNARKFVEYRQHFVIYNLAIRFRIKLFPYNYYVPQK